MTTLRKAAQQALEALSLALSDVEWRVNSPTQKVLHKAYSALRDVLAQEEPRNQCGETCERAKLCAVCARELEGTAQPPCDIAEDNVCEVIDCCRNSTQEEQEPTVRFKCTVVDDRHPNGVPFEQWVNAPRREWQGLTEEVINDGRNQLPTEDLCGWSFRQGVYFAEKALKEKNHG